MDLQEGVVEMFGVVGVQVLGKGVPHDVTGDKEDIEIWVVEGKLLKGMF